MSLLTALQIFGAVQSYSSAQSAANDAREAGDAAAQLSELETGERIRRYRYSFKQDQASRVVAAAKSGVRLEGTPATVMAEAALVAEREISFIQEQGKRTAAARRKEAMIQASSLESQATGTLIGDVAQIGSDNNWWGKIK